VATAACNVLVVACLVLAVTPNLPTTLGRPLASRGRRPAAAFTSTPSSGTAPLTVHFSDASSGSPTAWKWQFGDGTSAAGPHPAHVYTAAGNYTVSLSATNAAGTTTVTKKAAVAVSAPTPQADWTTVVDDQFDTPGVPSHWLLYSGSYTGDPSSCASPSQVQVPGDGYLHLKMEYRTSGICGHDWYTGGMQIAKAYGGVDQAITVRWRIVPAKDPEVVRSTLIIPMRWVDDPQYAWYQGEADYCEGSSLDGCYLYLHYGPDYQQIVHDFSVDLTQWHTFRFAQRDHQVSVFIDDMVNPVWVYKGDATTIPGAFMRTVLQQSCALSSGCPPVSYAGEVEDVQIDWITIQNAIGTDNPQAGSLTGAAAPRAVAVANGTGAACFGATKPGGALGAQTAEPRRCLLAEVI
jgi:hypothetical protein